MRGYTNDLHTCLECGSTVHPTYWGVHDDWHNQLKDKLEELNRSKALVKKIRTTQKKNGDDEAQRASWQQDQIDRCPPE